MGGGGAGGQLGRCLGDIFIAFKVGHDIWIYLRGT